MKLLPGEMSGLEKSLEDVRAVLKAEPDREFPYEELQQLQIDYAKQFQAQAPGCSIAADFNEYYMFVTGLASGGIKGHLSDNKQRDNVRHLLGMKFAERYPRYQFLTDIDLSPYPSFRADLELTDTLRRKLLQVFRLEQKRRVLVGAAGLPSLVELLTRVIKSVFERRSSQPARDRSISRHRSKK